MSLAGNTPVKILTDRLGAQGAIGFVVTTSRDGDPVHVTLPAANNALHKYRECDLQAMRFDRNLGEWGGYVAIEEATA